MYLKRYKPVNTRSLVDDFFNRSISDFVGSDFTLNHPGVNIVENSDNFVYEIAAPGLQKEDFKVTLDKGRITISAEKSVEAVAENEKYTRREFNFSKFSRSFIVPKAANKEEITANYSNGILNITLLKKEEAKEQNPVVIDIE